MFQILFIFLILIVGFFAGPLLQWQQGSASFVFAKYIVEMSFTTFIVLQLAFLLCLYIIYHLCLKILHSKTALGNWLRSKTQSKANKLIEQAQLSLLEDNYDNAIELFSKAAKSTGNKAFAYLFQAQASLNANHLIEAYQLLEKAAKFCQQREQFAFLMVKLRLQFKNQEYDLIHSTIAPLLTEKSINPAILKLAYELYLAKNDYHKIIDFLPVIQKAKIYNELEFDKLTQKAYIDVIAQFAEQEDHLGLITWWHSLPKSVKQNAVYKDAMQSYLEPMIQIDDVQHFLNSL